LQDFRYVEAAKREIDKNDFEVLMLDRECNLKSCMSGMYKRVGYEDNFVTCRKLDDLKKSLPDIEFVPAGDVFEVMRRTKTREEVDCIIKAQRIAEKSFDELLPRITYNATETELAAELEYIMKKNGSEGISFDTIAVSGKNSSSPHGVPRNVQIEKGFLTFDFGAMCKGYHSDMTRTIVIGKADAEMKRLYNTVLEAQLAALAAIGPGESCFKMDKIARDIIDGAGYKGGFGHSLGHGVGLEIHETPGLAPNSGDKILVPGDVVTVEPGIYLFGKYGCRIEDMVYITETEAENLTAMRKDLIEI
jgi:Xaa-Pro aminopeptidase